MNWVNMYFERIFNLVWGLIFRFESLISIFASLSSISVLGMESFKSKSKILPRYLKCPPKGTAGILPLDNATVGSTCWNLELTMAAPKDRHLSNRMSIFDQLHQASKR